MLQFKKNKNGTFYFNFLLTTKKIILNDVFIKQTAKLSIINFDIKMIR